MFCKFSKKKIDSFMSFGKMPLANGFLEKKDFKNEFFFNLEVGFSEKYSLFQINEFPSPKKMFGNNYPFFTSSSKFMIDHFKNYSNWIKKKILKTNSKLIEIGSNDGTFLKNFKNSGIDYIGFEPAKNIFKKNEKYKLNIVNDFFSYKSLQKNYLKKFIKKTDVICGSNVICHIPYIREIIEIIKKLLTKKGFFIFEEPYLGSMFEKTAYDQIYDEHIFMFSVSSIKKIFQEYDMDLIDIMPQKTHGGSIRYIIANKKIYSISKNVKYFLEVEKRKKIDSIEGCLNFKRNCEISKHELKKKLLFLKKKNKKISGYGATSKSTTVLNYCNIGPDIIDHICDSTKDKIGKFSPGKHIPVVPISTFRQSMPDFCYLFAWNHKKEIFLNEKKFLKNGGKWISHVKL